MFILSTLKPGKKLDNSYSNTNYAKLAGYVTTAPTELGEINAPF